MQEGLGPEEPHYELTYSPLYVVSNTTETVLARIAILSPAPDIQGDQPYYKTAAAHNSVGVSMLHKVMDDKSIGFIFEATGPNADQRMLTTMQRIEDIANYQGDPNKAMAAMFPMAKDISTEQATSD